MKKVNFHELLEVASMSHLTDDIPDKDEWEAMDEDEQDNFISERIWEPFEYYSPQQVWDFIHSSACSMQRFLESKGVEVIQ